MGDHDRPRFKEPGIKGGKNKSVNDHQYLEGIWHKKKRKGIQALMTKWNLWRIMTPISRWYMAFKKEKASVQSHDHSRHLGTMY